MEISFLFIFYPRIRTVIDFQNGIDSTRQRITLKGGKMPDNQIDAWLRSGGLLVTASDRATRAVTAAFHQARRAEGLTAWPAPNIQDWKSFVRAAWLAHTHDGRLVLNTAQEQSLWAETVGSSRHLATLLDGPRQRLAALAMEAQERLSLFAPRYLRESARSAWQQDAEAFSGWLTTFDTICQKENLRSESRLPVELIPLLEAETMPRPPLLLAGFDRLLPLQRELFDAWGEWQQIALGKQAAKIHFHEAPDEQTELEACALWANQRLTAKPNATILVITQDASQRRGEIERTFLKFTGSLNSNDTQLFEFSLGLPLSKIALTKAALLALRWLDSSLSESEIDWLLSTGQLAASEQESLALQSYMRMLRRKGLEQPQWTLTEFLNTNQAAKSLPDLWAVRAKTAQQLLESSKRIPRTPLDWTALVPRLLATLRWPGPRPLSSAEFQALRSWQQAVEQCGTLGFDGRRIPWPTFLDWLARALSETLFAPESRNAPIQIAGPAESAGLTADAIWFLGVSEDAWPASGSLHPLIPVSVQREAAMPHATAQLDWDLARSITMRLLASAPEVHFSYAKQGNGVEAQPSRLVAAIAGPQQPLPNEFAAPKPSPPLTEAYTDHSRIPFPHSRADGGADVLTAQSNCPFQAFAKARLGAEHWQPAEAGFTPAQRGILLHAALHAVWAGPPSGIRSHTDLEQISDLRRFVEGHVRSAFREKITAPLRARMPQRYLELEEQRLIRLITEWLKYESTRFPFEVAGTELASSKSIAGLALDLRLDRVDRLNDNTLLVIDYKTGQVSPKVWNLPRPENVQLPLYAGFALEERFEEFLGGLVFAKLSAGEMEFSGRVGDPASTLLPGLKGHNSLVRNLLQAEDLIDWRNCIELLARDFLSGNAEVNPRDPEKTCERCGLQTICRIEQHSAGTETDGEVQADE